MDKLEYIIQYYERECTRAKHAKQDDEDKLRDLLVEIRNGIGDNLQNDRVSVEYTAIQLLHCYDKLTWLLRECSQAEAQLNERETALMLVKRLNG